QDGVATVGERAEYPYPELLEVPARLLQQDREIDRRAATAAVFGRDGEAEPAVLAERVVRFARRARLAVAALGVLRRADRAQQLLHVSAQAVLFGREGEIHRQFPSRLASSSTRFARWYMA